MRWLDKLLMRIQMLFRRGHEDARLNDELQFHLDQQIAENIEAGMTPAEARLVALRMFGNPTLLREQTRDTWSWGDLELLLHDLRHGIRTLTRTPGFSFLAVLVMALGIGANVALLTVVKSVLLNPLPFKDQHQLVRIYEADSHGAYRDIIVDGGSFATWQVQAHSFDQMAIKLMYQYDLADPNGQLPEVALSHIASWNIFPMLGVRPALGRLFTANDDRPEASSTVVLTWGLWKRRYGGDPAILGKTILLDARPFTVIGVLPAWFTYPDAQVQLWTPLYNVRSRSNMQMFDAHNFDVVGRLKPGITIAQANAELNTIQQSIRKQHPQGAVLDATSLRPILDAETYTVKTSLYTLLAATGCLLLIACLNIANLLVARALTRRRETAIRTALGSTRSRLIRQQIMESLLLSCAGGVFGFLLAAASLQWLVHARSDIPRAESIHIDIIVVLFTTILILTCGLLAGLIPALSSDDKHILQALHQSSRSYSGGKSGTQLRRTLLSVQVGLTVVLLIGAGLLIKSYSQLRSVNLGCATQNVLTMRFKLPKNTAQNISSFHQQLLAQVRSQPGVKAAGLVTILPAEGHQEDDVFRIAEHPPLQQGKVLSATTRFADPGYFSAMQIPLLHGQFFRTAQPADPQQQVVISQEFARIYFPNEDPIGKHIISSVTDDEATYEIAGVVANTLEEVSGKPSPTIYYSIFMGSERFGALAIRAVPGQDALTLALPIQKVIAGIDRDLPVSRVLTMDQIIGQSTLGASFNATLLLAFAIISLVLATVGLFGVLTYIITQRTTEIGVRLALGSTRQQVMHLMLKDGLRPALFGLALGLLASIGVTRLIRSMLFGTTGLDPSVFIIVSTTLLLAATVACIIPAWRASRLDPVVALRAE